MVSCIDALRFSFNVRVFYFTSPYRGRPAVQANAVFALAGLATTVAKYANTLNADATAAASKVTEHLGMPHWLSMVLNTILSILDVNFKPTSRIFHICQQVKSNLLSESSKHY